MDSNGDSALFVNDGSFMERFKQIHQEKDSQNSSESYSPTLEVSRPNSIVAKSKIIENKKAKMVAPIGKLAFSLKQKSKLASPGIKLVEDDDEEISDANGQSKKPKLSETESPESSSEPYDAPPSPSDPAVKKVADKLASFVAKNGRQFEHVTRQRNPGDTPFSFLFDERCSDYKYYEYRLLEEERELHKGGGSKPSLPGNSSTPSSNRPSPNKANHQIPPSTLHEFSEDARVFPAYAHNAPLGGGGGGGGGGGDPSHKWSAQNHTNYQTPASALYESVDDPSPFPPLGHNIIGGDSNSDSLARMEFYMKKAAQEERRRNPRRSNDEMPPPSSLQETSKKGHHMGDYIPVEELEKFMASCSDAMASKYTKEAMSRAKIQADNVGHRLLSKMGWKEGEGLGSTRKGRSDPIMAGDVKKDLLGVGAHKPGEVTPEDDIYEQYKKRMMLGYKHRPNPLNNPRKSYY